MSRIISALLAVLLTALAAVSCSEPAEGTAETSLSGGTNTQTTATEPFDSLPAGLDFKGAEVRVRVDDSNSDFKGHAVYFIGPEEPVGDVVYDEVLARNSAVEERLNVSLAFTEVSFNYDKTAPALRALVLAGDDAYHFIVEQQYGCSQLANEGMFINALECKYFDFERPWWWTGYMDAIAIGADKAFIVAGDYFIDLLRSSYMMFFNKTIFENQFGESGTLYKTALDGRWTLDALSGYVKESYSDLNGDGKPNAGDRFGLPLCRAITDHFVYGTDVRFSSRDKDGIIRLDPDAGRLASLAETFYRMTYENPGVYTYSDDTKLRAEQVDLFMNGQTLFIAGSCVAFDSLRYMDGDFGILPMPKISETQESYRTVPHDIALTGVIPVTCGEPDMTSAVIEALCSESYRSVMPVFYETALKVKYSRDEQSTRMIDMIHDSITTEFVYVHSSSLNTLGTIFRALYTDKSYDFASAWATRGPGAEAALKTMTETYNALS